MDEQQAVARLQRGDPGGLETLVKNHQLRAVRTACLITGDRALAEDIVQNAFLRAAERIAQFDPSRPFGPWFLRSVIRDAVKAGAKQKRLVAIDSDTGLFELTDPAPRPEALAEARETAAEVRRALEKLSPNQRAAVVMRYYLGMSEDEMAHELNGPVGTVKWWLHEARRRLARLLWSSDPAARGREKEV